MLITSVAMSAAAAAITVTMLVTFAVAAALLAAVAAVTAAAAAAASLSVAGHLLHVLDLVGLGGFAHLEDLTYKVQRHTCQWSVEVDLADHLVFLHLHNLALHDLTVLVLQRQLAAHLHKLHWAATLLQLLHRDAYAVYVVLVIFTVCLGRAEGEVETSALFHAFDILFKTSNQLAYAEDELEWLIGSGLLDVLQFDILFWVLWCFVSGERVAHCHMFAEFYLHLTSGLCS